MTINTLIFNEFSNFIMEEAFAHGIDITTQVSNIQNLDPDLQDYFSRMVLLQEKGLMTEDEIADLDDIITNSPNYVIEKIQIEKLKSLLRSIYQDDFTHGNKYQNHRSSVTKMQKAFDYIYKKVIVKYDIELDI